MAYKSLTKEEYINLLSLLNFNKTIFYDGLYEIYLLAINNINALNESGILKDNRYINHFELVQYELGEFVYSFGSLSEEEVLEKLTKDEYKISIATVVADKFISLTVFNYSETKIGNRFSPPESTLNIYLNFLLKTLEKSKRNNPRETLISDLLVKSISLARCILNLLNNGYETTAYASWRTLHECECTLLILVQYGDKVIEAYLKHMKYGYIFSHGGKSKEETDKVFETIKSEMRDYELKSKDMKKYIEYGWLYAIDEFKNNPTPKLNFRDGMEPIAKLDIYGKSYIQSSELIHCTPLLIYSNKDYFYSLCLLSLYESFFRIEKVFAKLIDEYIPKEVQAGYENMKRIYFQQLVNIHKIESLKFKSKFVKNN